MRNELLLKILEQFNYYSTEFQACRNRGNENDRLAVELARLRIASGMIATQAIDAGLFGRDVAKLNGGWWDRSLGQVPGGPMTVYGRIPSELVTMDRSGVGRLDLGDTSNAAVAMYLKDVQELHQPWQFDNLWGALVEWLQRQFPTKMRSSDRLLFPRHREYTEEEKSQFASRSRGLPTKDREHLRRDRVITRRSLRHQADASAMACGLLAHQTEEVVRDRERVRATVAWASRKARRIGRSVPKLLGWIYTCRGAGSRYDESFMYEDRTDSSLANIDVGGFGWHIASHHVGEATGFHDSEIAEIASFVGVTCPKSRPDLRTKYDKLQEKLNLPENLGLIDIILLELDERCPGLAADIPRTVPSVIKAIDHLEPLPDPGASAPRRVRSERTMGEQSVEWKTMAMAPNDLAEELKCSAESINRYAAATGLTTPGQGERSFRYKAGEVVKIMQHASTRAGGKKTRRLAMEWLEVHRADSLGDALGRQGSN